LFIYWAGNLCADYIKFLTFSVTSIIMILVFGVDRMDSG